MKTIQYSDVTHFALPSNKVSYVRTRWINDIAKFDELVEIARKISAMQTVLMEYIRETSDLLKHQTTARVDAYQKTRQAYADACPSLSQKVKVSDIKATQQNLQAAQKKLGETDQKLSDVQDRTRRLERKILIHEPEDQSEAVEMIQFLSRLFKAHGGVSDLVHH